MFEYKGYTGAITTTDTEAGFFHGQLLGIQDVVTFEGKTVAELEKAFRDSVEDYLDLCATTKEGPEKPFSGRFDLRMKSDLHRQAVAAALKEDVSMNAWIVAAVEQRLQAEGHVPAMSLDAMEYLAESVAAILAEKQRRSAAPSPTAKPRSQRGSARSSTVRS